MTEQLTREVQVTLRDIYNEFYYDGYSKREAIERTVAVARKYLPENVIREYLRKRYLRKPIRRARKVTRKQFDENLWHTIVARTMENGGLTFNPRTRKEYDARNGGYAVGGLVPSVKVAVNENWHNAVKQFVLDNAEVFLHNARAYIGTWIDHDENVIWLDASEVYDDVEVALAVAAQRGEKAIWDFANMRAIDVE